MTAHEMFELSMREWCDVQEHLPWLKLMARGDVLEIGVRQGASTSALICGVEEKGGHVWSIDKGDCCVFDDPCWTFLQMDSHLETGKILEEIHRRPFSFLFLDGDHSYEGCLSDLLNFAPLAQMVAVHDTDSIIYPGVIQALTTYFRCSQEFQTLHLRKGSYGMGILNR